jgi:hypothetical protein
MRVQKRQDRHPVGQAGSVRTDKEANMTTTTRTGVALAIAAALATTPAFADKGGTPDGGNGTDNPNAAQPATPAQPGAPGGGAQPATPAQPAPKAARKTKPAPTPSASARRAAPAKPAKPARTRPAKAQGPKIPDSSAPSATTAPAKARKANPRAKAGKITICHATGSSTNPYVEITVSRNAVKAHADHQDGRDIIPAPAEGCPGAAPPEQAAAGTPEQQAADSAPAATGTEPQPTSGVLGVSATRSLPAAALLGVRLVLDDTAGSEVLGATASSPADEGARALPVATATSPDEVKGLPFTGLELGIVAALGLAALLAGFALRRAQRGPAA